MKGIFLLLAPVLGFFTGCSEAVCDCPSDVGGLVITTSTPITAVTLSGKACVDGRFRCIQADFDSVVHDSCMKLQIEPQMEGLCIVDVTLGGGPVRVERQMTRRPPGCCGGFIGEANHAGEIDLTMPIDTDGGQTIDANSTDSG